MSTIKRIPGFSRYGISESAELFNLETGEQLKTSRSQRGYHNTTLVDDSGVRKTVKRHRLVALAHLPKPEGDVSNLVVGHKDETPGNDWKDNLEWCTQKQNVEHWSKYGKARKRIGLEVMDVKSGKVTKYTTVADCSRDLGIERYSIHIRLERGPQYVWPEGKRYRTGQDGEEWPETSKLKYGRARDVMLKDLVSGVTYIYSKLSDVLPYLGFKMSTVWLWASDPSQPVLPGLYQLQFTDEAKAWREVTDPFEELQRGFNRNVVFVFDCDWTHAVWYNSASECASAMDLKPTALNYRLKSKGQTVFKDGNRYCYYDDLDDVQKKTIRYEVPRPGGCVQRPSKAAT